MQTTFLVNDALLLVQAAQQREQFTLSRAQYETALQPCVDHMGAIGESALMEYVRGTQAGTPAALALAMFKTQKGI
jgi:hypothetical protein